MKELKEQELEKINGGFSYTIALTIGVIVTFVIGIFNGYVNEDEGGVCNAR